MFALVLVLCACFATPAAAQDRQVVDASEPSALAVTVYRDPNRGPTQDMNRDWPQGFAMISETRSVTLPAGESTIRFDGVAEGMVAVSAIVTGLPGGTIEKNRNADLLSPAALVDGTLGNRVRITRTNPGTGEAESESAIIRTRADGGLVLQTGEGYEAVRCSGLPERLTFSEVPDGLSAQPVFTIDTRDESGGTYEVTLSYLAWGFDWQANYVATLHEGGSGEEVTLGLVSWLTILNDNGQSFENAELMAVAGRLEVVSDFRDLADPPEARPLRLTCFPIGSTARGSPVGQGGQLNRLPGLADYQANSPIAQPAPPPAMAMEADREIVVTGSRMMAAEEDLGDLKLYRIPEPVTVAAQGMKQVAFLDQDRVEAAFQYRALCYPQSLFDHSDASQEFDSARIVLLTRNDEEHGLGVALPRGPVAVFEPGPAGQLLVGEPSLRDHAVDQEVELELGDSTQVFSQCARIGPEGKDEGWIAMRGEFSNANDMPVVVRVTLGRAGGWDYRWDGHVPYLKNGSRHVEITVPANSSVGFDWSMRSSTLAETPLSRTM